VALERGHHVEGRDIELAARRDAVAVGGERGLKRSDGRTAVVEREPAVIADRRWRFSR